jgi:multiple sugar transport system permease protein
MATEPVGSSLASAPPLTAEGRRMRGMRGRPKRLGRDTLTAYLFLTPYLFVLLVFLIFASLYGLGLSLFSVDIGFTAPQFVGFQNYQRLFEQLFTNPGLSVFWISMANILKFVIAVVICQTILALILALILQVTLVGRGIFRTIFYIPAVTSSVATALIFLWLYNPDGLINYLLSLVHISGPDWLNDPLFALPALMLLNIWTTAAAFMIYFMAALQDLPKELLEASAIDGANRFQTFRYITVPLLRPTIFLVVALGTIGSFQMFDQAKFMTNGGPLNSTLTPLLEIYNAAFQDAHFGLAAAMSVLLFIIIFIVTIVQRRLIEPSTSNR